MSRPIFHELQIEAVQHGADRDAEKHSKNAEHLAFLPPAHNVPSGGRADIDCKEVFHSFNSHSILGKNAATEYPAWDDSLLREKQKRQCAELDCSLDTLESNTVSVINISPYCFFIFFLNTNFPQNIHK